MQESGPAPAVANRRNAAKTPSRRRTARRRKRDPLIRWLTVAIVAIVVLWLAGVVSAIVFGMFNQTGAPRTQVERDLNYYTDIVGSGQANTRAYAQYVDALVRAGQYAKAQDALSTALPKAKSDTSFLLAEQAQLDLINKDYEATVKSADKAMADAQKELKAFMAANVKANRKPGAGAKMPDSFETAALAKATALVELKKDAKAIEAYDVYLKYSPTDSDILVLRGQAKARSKDTSGAAADYRAALRFIPDYQPAIDGLKKIGAAK